MSAFAVTRLQYDHGLEEALARLDGLLQGDYGLSRRSVALLLLQGDAEIEKLVAEREAGRFAAIQEAVSETRSGRNQPLAYVITMQRQRQAGDILAAAMKAGAQVRGGFAQRLSRATMHPLWGSLILLAVLYFGLYQFVGVLGAGTFVGFIENTVFGEWVSPWVTGLVTRAIPVPVIQDLLVGEYGMLTLGMSYAIAIILPIVGMFFIIFSIIEDSGYLPRLAMLLDTTFKRIGLSGRAVIPMVLGFGCDTMATIVTRTEETKRERVITTLLLALAIPCSAQLGVILAILSGNALGLLLWAGVVVIVLLLVGFLAAQIMPGEKATFYMEVPPLRLPRLSNVALKTYTRLQWYFMEVLPFFLLASFILWLGKLTGVFDLIIRALTPVVQFAGLPAETAVVFLYGFFRRDFGAAGLYDMANEGSLAGVPLLVAAVTLTLFIPCIAQFMVMLKERGARTAIAIAAFIFPFAFLVGFLLNVVLLAVGVAL